MNDRIIYGLRDKNWWIAIERESFTANMQHAESRSKRLAQQAAEKGELPPPPTQGACARIVQGPAQGWTVSVYIALDSADTRGWAPRGEFIGPQACDRWKAPKKFRESSLYSAELKQVIDRKYAMLHAMVLNDWLEEHNLEPNQVPKRRPAQSYSSSLASRLARDSRSQICSIKKGITSRRAQKIIAAAKDPFLAAIKLTALVEPSLEMELRPAQRSHPEPELRLPADRAGEHQVEVRPSFKRSAGEQTKPKRRKLSRQGAKEQEAENDEEEDPKEMGEHPRQSTDENREKPLLVYSYECGSISLTSLVIWHSPRAMISQR